jgi:hypothetical protein
MRANPHSDGYKNRFCTGLEVNYRKRSPDGTAVHAKQRGINSVVEVEISSFSRTTAVTILLTQLADTIAWTMQRRRYLALAGASMAALAGCSEDAGENNSSGGETEAAGADAGTEMDASTETPAGGTTMDETTIADAETDEMTAKTGTERRTETEMSTETETEETAMDTEAPTPTSTPDGDGSSGQLAITDIQPEGDDETITLQNTGDSAIDLSGYQVSFADDQTYRIEGVTLGGGETLTVHTGEGSDSAGDVYAGFGSSVLNNDGDTVTIRDSSGTVVAQESY